MFKGKKMAGHMGDVNVTTQNLARGEDRPRARADHDPRRGARRQGRLGDVARCGEAGLPETAPKPGAFRKVAGDAPKQAGTGAERLSRASRGGERKRNAGRRHHARRQEGGNGRAAGRCVRARAARRHPRNAWCAISSPSGGGGTRSVQDRSEVNYTDAKLYRQKGTGRARHGSRRAPLFRGGGKAFGPEAAQLRHRSAEEGEGARAEACAVLQGQVRDARSSSTNAS